MTANVSPLLVWGGVGLIVFDHFGPTIAGVSLILGAIFSMAVTQSQSGGQY